MKVVDNVNTLVTKSNVSYHDDMIANHTRMIIETLVYLA